MRGNGIAIYGVEEAVKRKRQGLQDAGLSAESVGLILGFVDYCAAQGLTAHRQSFYLTQLKGLAEILGEAFPDPTREDVERAVSEIERRPYSDWTKTNYKTALKRFYKWLLGEDEEYPPAVRWVKTRRNRGRELPEGLLTPEEIKALVEACVNPRDRSLISSLADSGCRIGEILSMRVGDVRFDEYGAVFLVTGKTGDRRVRVLGDSVPYLEAWLDAHPGREDPGAPLWVGLEGAAKGEALNYAAARKVLQSAARRAGLKKRVHAHLFRHTRATQLAAKVAEGPLAAAMGWTVGSAMSQTYVHLSGRDVDRAILEAEGIELPTAGERNRRRLPVVCPRCEAINLTEAGECRRCKLPLSEESILRAREAEESIVARLERLEKLLEERRG